LTKYFLELPIKFQFTQVKGIIFDLDDTLVETSLDFAAIKRDIACPAKADILTFIDNLSCSKQQDEASRIVREHELNDAQTSVWLPGAKDFVEEARQHALPLAIVTRNCRQATELKLNRNNIGIDFVITREDAPAKPDPTALLSIANEWQIKANEIAYLGDYIYDIQAAHNADMQAWLYKYQVGVSDYKTCLSYVARI
jgi:HAD superfamily hydrolase (TIGR01549 family)